MSELKFYNSKTRSFISIVFWTALFISISLQCIQTSILSINLAICIILVLMILYEATILLNSKPSLNIDACKISFPSKNESINWNDIDSIEFHNIKKVNESITIKSKYIDSERKKINVPRVFNDFDDEGGLDYSLYEINLEMLKVENEFLYKLIKDLNEKNKYERELLINSKIEELKK